MAGNINPNPFTTRPEIEGTFGVVTSTHWIATARRHGHPGARRQRLRRRGRHRLHAAGGRAAPQRPGRRRAGDRSTTCARASPRSSAARAPRPPARPSRITERRPRHGARHRPARGLRARHVRHLDAAAARLRHDEARRRADARDLLRAERPSAGRARQRHHPDGREAVPRSLADLGRGLPAGRQAGRDRLAVHQQDAGRDLHARAEGGRERRRRPRRADREGAQGLVAGLRRRGDRQVLPHPEGDGHQRHAAHRRADRPGHGEVAGARRSAADLRLRPLHRLQGAVEPGPGDAAAARAAQGLQPRRPRRGRAGLHPSRWSNARSSPTPTARSSTAIRTSSRCRSRRCSRTPTTPNAASSSPTRPRWSCGRARSRASARW